MSCLIKLTIAKSHGRDDSGMWAHDESYTLYTYHSTEDACAIMEQLVDAPYISQDYATVESDIPTSFYAYLPNTAGLDIASFFKGLREYAQAHADASTELIEYLDDIPSVFPLDQVDEVYITMCE